MRLAAVTAMIAAIALAAGCGDDGDETTTETTTPATATGATGSDVEQVSPPLEAQKGAKTAPGSGGSAVSPREALEGFFTSGVPDIACGELATEELLSSAYGDEQGCREAQVPAAVPDSIEITELEESGGEATATVIPDGGPNDGIETEVVLVKEGSTWLVDSLEADVPAGP
jgi:hypothetical protein